MLDASRQVPSVECPMHSMHTFANHCILKLVTWGLGYVKMERS
jgi:hypothetical protein